MTSPLLIPIGGFLGAGKTSLLAAAAEMLESRGVSAAAITNDQAGNLVDTAFLRARGMPVAEVAGGCFCCRFDDLEHAATELERSASPRAILAEPVGSCTDLASTVIRPWRALLGRPVAPATVLIDPERLDQALDPSRPGPLAPEAAYIMSKQLEEADAIVLSKCDTLEGAALDRALASIRRALPGRPVFAVSVVTGVGVRAWLDYAVFPESAGAQFGTNWAAYSRFVGPGQRRIDVDYDVYARGEAVLGWLNARGTTLVGGSGGAALAHETARRLQHACRERSAAVAHIKVRVENEDDAAQAHATSDEAMPETRGDCPAGPGRFTLNARVQIDPPTLESIARESCSCLLPVGVQIEELRCFSPGRPVPRHRL